jgi:nucleoside-diphosphate-sugar epimerase
VSTSVPSRAFLTGADGFIASAVASRLRADGWEVAGVDLADGDVASAGSWQSRAAGASLVIHTAALVTNAADLDASWRVNVLGTRRALDAAVRAGASRFVHLSSVRAFSDVGFPDGVDESWPVRPDGNPYVDTKVASEQVVLQAHAAGEIECTVIRPGDVYGPGSRPWTLMPLELIRARRFLLPAMGRGVFSPVYVDDLVEGVLLAARSEAGAGQVFTLTGGSAVTTGEFFGSYVRMLRRRWVPVAPTWFAVAGAAVVCAAARGHTEIRPQTMRYLARRGTYSIDKARRLLGYAPAVDLTEGMARTEAWLRDRGLL